MGPAFDGDKPVYSQRRFWTGLAVFTLLTGLWLLAGARCLRATFQPIGGGRAAEVAFERGSFCVKWDCGIIGGTFPPGFTASVEKALGFQAWPGISLYTLYPSKAGTAKFLVGPCVTFPLWPVPLGWMIFWARRMRRRRKIEIAFRPVPTS